jgi:hypothetical protein
MTPEPDQTVRESVSTPVRSPDEAKCGVLYVVIGDRDQYATAAARSATSLKRVMPDVSIAIVTNRTVDGPFDHHIRIDETDGFRAKIRGMGKTPFERTVFLDADTFVLADISDAFELLGGFDMALVQAPIRVSLPLDDVPASFPEFNTGVVAYRNTPLVQSVLDDWLREYDDLLPRKPLTWDQPSFRRVAYRTAGLRIATLPSEFNRRFDFAGYFKGPIRVLHGWPLQKDGYGRIVDALGTWSPDAPMVFAGGRVFDSNGEQVADFLPPQSSFREAGRRRRLVARRAQRRLMRLANRYVKQP